MYSKNCFIISDMKILPVGKENAVVKDRSSHEERIRQRGTGE